MERLYLDICCLKRPFDDQRDARIRHEAAAVADIFAEAEAGRLQLVRSPAHRLENDANPREDRRLAAALWLDGFAIDTGLDATVEARARVLVELGFGALDALHLAFAEAAGATIRDLRRAARQPGPPSCDRAAPAGPEPGRDPEEPLLTPAGASSLSDYDIRREGWKALTERLGVSGAIRFLAQYDSGRGDYVAERREMFAGVTLDDLLERARLLPPSR